MTVLFHSDSLSARLRPYVEPLKYESGQGKDLPKKIIRLYEIYRRPHGIQSRVAGFLCESFFSAWLREKGEAETTQPYLFGLSLMPLTRTPAITVTDENDRELLRLPQDAAARMLLDLVSPELTRA